MPTSDASRATTLVLCPTDLERRLIEEEGALTRPSVSFELCGFGPIVAAARTADRIAELRPSRVVLVGIAGTYDAALAPPGSAQEFDEVAVDGVGVGEGVSFLSPAGVGFPQWAGDVPSRNTPIVDTLPLASSRATDGPPRLLLTACAASADAAHATRRRRRFPLAMAEDMEGFGVAAACALANVPLRIVRGISNVVGDRNVATWCMSAALHAARAQLVALLDTDSGWRPPG